MGDEPHDDVDVLESATTSRFPPRLVTVVAAVAALVAIALAARTTTHPRPAGQTPSLPANAATPPSPVGSAAAVAVAAPTEDLGSVFFDPLTRCTRADGDGRLNVAVRLTNLSSRPLRIVTATVVDPRGVRLTELRVGAGPCATGSVRAGQRWLPSRDVVVALSFAVGPECPRNPQLAVWLGFDEDHRILRAESPPLVDLTRADLGPCGPP